MITAVASESFSTSISYDSTVRSDTIKDKIRICNISYAVMMVMMMMMMMTTMVMMVTMMMMMMIIMIIIRIAELRARSPKARRFW